MRRMSWLPLLALFCLPCLAAELRLCQHAPEKYAYRLALTELILARTAASHGPLAIAPGESPDPSQERCLHLLREGRVDLAFVPPTAERLEQFEVIPVDILQGLLGYRLLLIHRDQAARFARVDSIEDLRQLRGGFGNQWGDFAVFAANNLPVVGMANPDNLLGMLAQGRFDYYHRGLHEAFADLASHPQYPQLMVEPHLLLSYPMPVYFTFNPARADLRARFEQGLRHIQADGSLQRLFDSHYGALVRRARLEDRTLLPLRTPLPEALPQPAPPPWVERR